MTNLAQTDRLKVWDAPLRLFHWLLVLAITTAFLSSENDSPIASWHMTAGWCAAVLLAFRLVWGLIGGEHACFARFVRPAAIALHVRELLAARPARSVGHNPLGAIAVVALLGLIGIVLWSGVSVAAHKLDKDFHETLAYGLLALIAVHVGAVVLMSFLTRENLVRAMVTGRKKAVLHPGARDAQAPGALALLFGAATIILTVILILRTEPTAFTPHMRDGAHEHR